MGAVTLALYMHQSAHAQLLLLWYWFQFVIHSSNGSLILQTYLNRPIIYVYAGGHLAMIFEFSSVSRWRACAPIVTTIVGRLLFIFMAIFMEITKSRSYYIYNYTQLYYNNKKLIFLHTLCNYKNFFFYKYLSENTGYGDIILFTVRRIFRYLLSRLDQLDLPPLLQCVFVCLLTMCGWNSMCVSSALWKLFSQWKNSS